MKLNNFKVSTISDENCRGSGNNVGCMRCSTDTLVMCSERRLK